MPSCPDRTLVLYFVTAPQLRTELEKLTARRVPLAYVNRLLHRHGWRNLTVSQVPGFGRR